MRFFQRTSDFERPRGARGIVPLIAAALAAGVARAGVGLLQGRNETRRKRNRINDAYTFGHERQNIMQQDVRGSEAERIASRGLAQGGDLQIGNAVAPNPGGDVYNVSGAHTLGGQQQADLHREQSLEQNDLLRQRDNAVSDVEAEGQQGAINSISSGIATGMQVAGMGAGGGPSPSIASAYSAAGQTPYYGGIHPTNPDMDSDWASGLARTGQTNAAFTKYGSN